MVSGIAEQALTIGGQYALVLADASPVVPPAPVAGALLSGVARATSPDIAQSQVTPEPRVLFASPDARSLVGGQVTSTAPVSSGLILRTRLVESYRFLNGEQWQPPVRLQDVVLYQRPVDALTLSAHFPVGPSRAFEAIALERGVIGVELRTADAATGAGIAGAAGGTVTGDGNLELVIPAGALGAPGQVAIRRVAVEDLGVPVPPGTTILDALDVVVPTTLARAAELSLPRAAGLLDATRVVLARLAEVNGRTRYVLAGLVELVGDRARVVLEVGGQPTGLPGVREAGTYVLLQASGPVGFATGRVVDPVGAAIIGAVVTPSTLPAVSVSDAAGRYFVAAPAGAVVLVAADEHRGDRGERPAFFTAQVMTPLTLTVLPVPPQVTSIRPADAATGVLIDDPISVTFSEPILASTLTGAVRLVGPGDSRGGGDHRADAWRIGARGASRRAAARRCAVRPDDRGGHHRPGRQRTAGSGDQRVRDGGPERPRGPAGGHHHGLGARSRWACHREGHAGQCRARHARVRGERHAWHVGAGARGRRRQFRRRCARRGRRSAARPDRRCERQRDDRRHRDACDS